MTTKQWAAREAYDEAIASAWKVYSEAMREE